MAKTYTICVGGEAASTTVTMTEGLCGNLRTYTLGTCTVTERTSILTFTATDVSEDDYVIYYTYEVIFYTNGIPDGAAQVVSRNVTMPAGSVVVTVEALCDYTQSCPDDSGDGEFNDGLGDGMV